MSIVRTHYRKADGLRAELLADVGGIALYNVDRHRRIGRGRDARLVIENRVTSCSSARFHRDFREKSA